MKTFRDLKVWEKAHELTLAVYKVAADFPTDERFGLSAQIKRSSASIATNIVEGFKRNGAKDKVHFVNLADSSLEETKYHLILARDLGFLTDENFERLTMICDEVGRMLNAYGRAASRPLTPAVSRYPVLFASYVLVFTSYFLILTSQFPLLSLHNHTKEIQTTWI